MEIQKIFSEIDTNEKLYSVLLSEDELALFSEISAEFEQREFGNKQNKALKNQYLREHFGGYESDPTKALRNARDTLRTQEISRFAGADPSQNFFITGSGSHKGVNGVINGEVKKTKGSLIYQLSSKNNEKFMNKHNLGYNFLTDSYYRKPDPSPAPVTNTVNETVNQAANRAPYVSEDPINNAVQELTKKKDQVTNQVNKNGSGMLQKGMEWASKHKVGLGVAAGTAAVAGGGAYLYNRAKKKNQEKDNNQ